MTNSDCEQTVVVSPEGDGFADILGILCEQNTAVTLLAVDAGKPFRYFSATELVKTLYRGLDDN